MSRPKVAIVARQANRALHLAVLSRIRLEPKTQAYVAKKPPRATPNSRDHPLPQTLAREIYFLLNPGQTSIPQLGTPE